MHTQALFQGLAPEESAEHARLLNEYVQALERHKRLMPRPRPGGALPGASRGRITPQTLESIWLADARIEATRRQLETFRREHGIP